LTYNAATDTFTGYYSNSGSSTPPTNWGSPITSYVVPMSGPAFLLGIADTAHNNGATDTAVFDNLGNLFANVNVLPATTALSIAGGAVLDLGGGSQQVGSLSDYAPGAGGSIINSNTGAASVLTLSSTGGSTTFSGMILGSSTLGTISLSISGRGTQVLSGSNSYSGGTMVSSGTLLVTNADALPNRSNLTVAGGKFIFDPSFTAGPGVVSSKDNLILAAEMATDYEPRAPSTSNMIFLPSAIDAGTISGSLRADLSDPIGGYVPPAAQGNSDSALNAVPEPSALALVAAGALGLLEFTRRRRTGPDVRRKQ
jgi:autotransporter-associated beta strand protein